MSAWRWRMRVGSRDPVHVVHHAGRRASAAVRAFVEHAVVTLRAVLEAP